MISDVDNNNPSRDLKFPVENITSALKRNGKKFMQGYREYVDMGNDADGVTINHKMKADMDAAELQAFLVEVRQSLALGDYFILQELIRRTNQGWGFPKNSNEAMEMSKCKKNFLYYNIQRSANGLQFSLAVCYLKSGRVMENKFVFYGGLTKEDLLRKIRAPEGDNFNLYLKV